MKSTKTVLSVILTLLLVSATALMPTNVNANTVPEPRMSSGIMDTCSGSVILHAWNWSYNTISENLEDIANAGYSCVQVSPVQEPKDYKPIWNEVKEQWWKLYQPISFNFADGNTWLGTREEFEDMCSKAHEYGIKVIVDIVANHLANNNLTTGNSANNRSKDIPAHIRNNDNYWHINNLTASDNTRREMVLGSIGQPDLNTGNKDVQQMVIDLMKDCVDMGADGFRFDAAKHIETPHESGGLSSDYWPSITNAVQKYSDKDIYFYAEYLNPSLTNPENYARYMSITDDVTSYYTRTYVQEEDAYGASDHKYFLNVGAERSVLWVESHDNYIDGTTSNLTQEDVNLVWSIVATRADATALYLARPNSDTPMGEAGDDAWKSKVVAEVNKFHNYFDGVPEYLSCVGNIVMNERGETGAMIANLSNRPASIYTQVFTLADGIYRDSISGKEFTVSGGRLSGDLDGKSVALLYKVKNEGNNFYVLFDNSETNWKEVYCYIYSEYNAYTDKNAAWPGELMKQNSDGLYFYEADARFKYGYVIFSSGAHGQQIPAMLQRGFPLDGTNTIYRYGENSPYVLPVNTELMGDGSPIKTGVIKRGDVTSDGVISMLDVVLMQKIAAGLVDKDDYILPDVDDNGTFNMRDITFLQRYIAGL